MTRSYTLEVIAKWYGTHGFGSITLRPPSVNGADLDIRRPWWVDRTQQGAPVTVDCTPEEMLAVEVGHLFTVTMQSVWAADPAPNE